MALSSLYGAPRTLVDNDLLRLGPRLITPFDSTRVQPASYDVSMGAKVLLPKTRLQPQTLDLRTVKPGDLMEERTLTEEGYALEPGGVALVSTVEMVTCPSDMLCSVDGKSTLGRCFLAVHVTAGFVDPGFVGNITMELVNHAPWHFVIYPGMRIGQLRFTWLAVEAGKPYGSPGLGSGYQGSRDVRAAMGQQERKDIL